MSSRKLPFLIVSSLLVMVAACGGDQTGSPTSGDLLKQGGEVDGNGKPTLEGTGWEEPRGKGDRIQGRQGLPTSVDGSATSVWEVENGWGETDAAAGIAWEEESGLTWNEKYRAWVDSLERTEATSYGETFMLKTPYGKSIPAPSLECAEAAIFLRVTFAAWYRLPFFMEARDRHGNRLYFGHFGIRTADGKWRNMPRFRQQYEDYSKHADEIRAGEMEWPTDSQLRSLGIPGSFDDEQPMIGEGAHAGAYFDEVFLNKRVGYFLRMQLIYFGSINLADPVNMFNLEPREIQPGDVLVERWQRSGIGHTLIVMRRRRIGTQEIGGTELPELEAELASGSMPRRQPKWEGPASSKRSLTLAKTGGEGYVEFGGGIKRWRVTREVGGRWTNVVPEHSEEEWINSQNDQRIRRRPSDFETLLVELSPEEKMESLAELAETKREHLRRNPSSCAARIAREDAFEEMYEVGRRMGMTKADVDRKYRKFEDYVFAELEYDASKTCCWLASTPAMYDLIIEYNLNRIEDPETGMCRDVAVFKARDDGADGYDLFRDYARSVGQSSEWVEWSAGESCPQRNVASDTEAEHQWTPVCQVRGSFDLMN